jgi:uncharacterized protein
MTVAVRHPGVYIQELKSGVRTITGVSTSTAAFIGWAPRGSVDKAELVLSWADYERKFGGLHPDSYLGYAVFHFFANGGGQAYICRVVDGGGAQQGGPQPGPAVQPQDGQQPAPQPQGGQQPAQPPGGGAVAQAKAKSAQLDIPNMLTATAVDPGSWAESYGIETRAASGKNFQLLVMRKNGNSAAPVEVYSNVSVDKASPRFIESVVNGKSNIVTVKVPDNAAATAHAFAPLKDGEDGPALDPTQPAFFGQLPSALDRLARVELFNLLAVPGLMDPAQIQTLATFCRERRAFLIVDANPETDPDKLAETPAPLPTSGPDRTHAALYYPWVLSPDPAQSFAVRAFPPSGFVAGIYARTDVSRGVWKAPAGTEAGIAGALGLSRTLTDEENGLLNPKGVNCLRSFPVFGTVVWGTRTTDGNDETGSEWKAIPVRRLALFIEESLYRGLKWTVFEPNDEPLWGQIRLNVGVFMHNLFRQGAFQGQKASDAYFVRCDKDTTTQADINLGIVNVVVGFAPLQPAEFVIIQLQQKAGQLES